MLSSFKHSQLTTDWLSTRFKDKTSLTTSVGSDGISPQIFEGRLDNEIAIIQRKVGDFSYRFSRLKEKLILKGKDSNPRVVSIPTVRDRLVIDALHDYIQQAFLSDLQPYQCRVQHHISNISSAIDSAQYDCFIKLDVKNFFPSLDHEICLKQLASRITDKTALSLVKKLLKRSENGIAQGLSIASLLADIYLNEIDRTYSQNTELKYFRFVDDILILCHSADEKAIKQKITSEMEALKLRLHSVLPNGKSATGTLKQDELQYLGFVFSAKHISVRESSVERLRQRIRHVFLKRDKEDIFSVADLYHSLNLKITGCLYGNKSYGWLFFFKQMTDLTLLHHLDWFVKSTFKSFGFAYNPSKIKSFVKAYFLMKDLKNPDENSYIPSFPRISKVGGVKKPIPKQSLPQMQIEVIELENDVLAYGESNSTPFLL